MPFQLRPEKKDTILWPSFVAPFQLPWLRRSNNDWKKKDTVVCPLLRHSNYDRKKKDTVVWPSFVVPFQLPWLRHSNYDQKKKKSAVCPLLRHSNYDRKKKDMVVWSSFVGPFQLPWLGRSNYDRKKRYSRLSVVRLFKVQPKKKIHSYGHHSLRRSNCHCCAVPITTGKKKIQSSVRCYTVPITTGKKRYSPLAIIRCAVPIAIVAPFQLQP
jgi:hypothetical protein